MARKLDELGPELVTQIERAWARKDLEDWQRKRLLVLRLIAQHRLDAKGIAEAAGVSRASVFNYRDKLKEGGVEGLLSRGWAGARKPAVRGAVAEEFGQALEQGKFRQAKDAQAWIAERTRKRLTVSGAWKVLKRFGGKLKAPRKSHAKKDQTKSDARELVGRRHQRPSTAKLAAHAAVKVAELVLGVVLPLGRQRQGSRRAVGDGSGVRAQELGAAHAVVGA